MAEVVRILVKMTTQMDPNSDDFSVTNLMEDSKFELRGTPGLKWIPCGDTYGSEIYDPFFLLTIRVGADRIGSLYLQTEEEWARERHEDGQKNEETPSAKKSLTSKDANGGNKGIIPSNVAALLAKLSRSSSGRKLLLSSSKIAVPQLGGSVRSEQQPLQQGIVDVLIQLKMVDWFQWVQGGEPQDDDWKHPQWVATVKVNDEKIGRIYFKKEKADEVIKKPEKEKKGEKGDGRFEAEIPGQGDESEAPGSRKRGAPSSTPEDQPMEKKKKVERPDHLLLRLSRSLKRKGK